MAATALITGATGLVGSWVLAHWDLSHLEAVALDHQKFDLLQPGVPEQVITRVRPSLVVHLAWVASGSQGYRHDAENDQWVRASLELQRSCRTAGVGFIGTGTGVDDRPESTDRYSAAKARLRRELAASIDAGEITWLRPYYVFDPARRRPVVVDQALTACALGRKVELRSPDSVHDFIHASDVGRAVVDVVRHSLRGEVSIGSGRLRRVSDLVDALGVPWSRSSDASTHVEQTDMRADIRRLRSINWSPTKTEEIFARD